MVGKNQLVSYEGTRKLVFAEAQVVQSQSLTKRCAAYQRRNLSHDDRAVSMDFISMANEWLPRQSSPALLHACSKWSGVIFGSCGLL